MDWIELSIDTPNEFVEPISQIFLRYANTDIAIIENIEYHPDEGETKPNNYSVTIKTYIEENQKSDSICTQIDIATRLIRYISPVGVFVNEPITQLQNLIKILKLDYIQLHGNEDRNYMSMIKKRCHKI